MKKELQNKLFEKYPKIFRQKDLPKQETCMCWGFQCGDGWYDLIDTLCSCIQRRVDYKGGNQVEATQVKTKFGGLRFYTDCVDDAFILGLIRMTEAMSYNIKEWTPKEKFLDKVNQVIDRHEKTFEKLDEDSARNDWDVTSSGEKK